MRTFSLSPQDSNRASGVTSLPAAAEAAVPSAAGSGPAQRASASASQAEAVQRARRQEREHLARELHDVLGSELTAARLQVACLRSQLADAPPGVGQRLQELDDALRAALALKRRIIDGLEPPALRSQGLASALQALVREFEGSGIRITADLEEVAAAQDVQLVIYRLVQESLTNMVKYAGAGEAEILLRNRGQRVAVFVRDDGRGFDAARAARGHGLKGMRHRVEGAGGRLAIESAPGQGTRIAADLPKYA